MQNTIKDPDPPSHLCPSCGAALRGAVAFCPSCGFALRTATGRLQTQQVLAGRYQIARLVARGGMGAVYQAEDIRLGGAPVAVKEMASSFVHGDTEAFERAVADFRREAAMLARLRHAHLPRVSDQFDEQGKHYLVMEFIAGRTLLDALRQAHGPLPVGQALGYADQLCDVLAYLHSQNPPIIYRDLKPSNVMIISHEDGGSRIEDRSLDPQSSVFDPRSSQVVLIDFGIARFYRPGQTGDTAIYGTTGYAPPEQYGRGQTDARTDIYALGVLLHQMLTSYDPTSTPFALPPPRTLNPAIPPHVAAAITRATTIDREARFADIASFRAALHMAELPTVRRRPQRDRAARRPQDPTPQRGRPGLVWAIIGSITALLVVAVTVFVLLRPLRADTPTPTAAPALVDAPTAQPETTAESSATAPAELTPAAPADVTPAIDSGSDSPTPPANNGPNVVLRPSRISASSAAEPGVDAQGNQITYDPQNAVDGRPDTTWRVAGDGAGQWLQLDFATEISVASIGMIPGYDKIDPTDNTDRFAQNRVVKVVRFEFSDGSTARASFAQIRTMQFVPLPQSVRTRSIRIVIEETFPPPPVEQGGRDFTPISEVQVQGMP
jgi:serine/threonine protein kinase, bacterial